MFQTVVDVRNTRKQAVQWALQAFVPIPKQIITCAVRRSLNSMSRNARAGMMVVVWLGKASAAVVMARGSRDGCHDDALTQPPPSENPTFRVSPPLPALLLAPRLPWTTRVIHAPG